MGAGQAKTIENHNTRFREIKEPQTEDGILRARIGNGSKHLYKIEHKVEPYIDLVIGCPVVIIAYNKGTGVGLTEPTATCGKTQSEETFVMINTIFRSPSRRQIGKAEDG